MPEVVGVSFRRAGKSYYFNINGLAMSCGDLVVVETVRGLELGRVTIAMKRIDESEVTGELKKVVRLASDEDLSAHYENRIVAAQALRTCRRKIREHDLAMKLVEVEYTLDGSKIVFYFSADGRVDFRNLVRELATIFKRRIELHQIGVRDEAKIIGGLGPCGRPVCCATFMPEFAPVSIKMAKEQNLSLNPERISGVCGRFMCCLKYEYDVYHESLKNFPPIGSVVQLPEGKAVIVEHCVPKEAVVAELPSKVRIFIAAAQLKDMKAVREERRPDVSAKGEPSQADSATENRNVNAVANLPKKGFRPTKKGVEMLSRLHHSGNQRIREISEPDENVRPLYSMAVGDGKGGDGTAEKIKVKESVPRTETKAADSSKKKFKRRYRPNRNVKPEGRD